MDPQTGGTPSTPYLAYLGSLTDRTDSVPENYFYHPDHLGSSSWITDSAGRPVQHLQYLPWGEDFVNQRTTDYAARFTFSAKEKDSETGFSYFGSRYYNSDLSIWLSVDPMSDKYPSMSPYVYCANNPIKLVDPNGEEWEIDGYIYTPGGTCPDNVSQSTKDKWNTMNKIYGTREGKTVIDAMNKEGVCYSVSSEKCPSGPAGGEYVSDGNKTGGTIYLNGVNSDVGLLAHEMFHGYQDLNNQGSQTIHNEVQARLFATDIQNQTFSPGRSQLTPVRGILPEVFSYNVDKVVSGTYSSQNMQYLEDTFKSHFDGYENVKKRKEGQTDLYGTIKTH